MKREKRNNKTRAGILILLFLLVTIADCMVTWLGTPDLAREANPLIALFGKGWKELLLVNVVVVLLYSFLVYYSMVIYEEKRGRGGSATLALLGATVSYSMIIARLMVVVEWVLDLTKSPLLREYTRFRYKVPGKRPDLLLALMIGLLSAIIWLFLDHRKTKRQLF